MTDREYGRHLFGEAQGELFNNLSPNQISALLDARFGRNGWLAERCIDSLRSLELLAPNSRKLTPRGMQMMQLARKGSAHD